MVTKSEERSLTKRGLILRDTVAFLFLILISVVLFTGTLVLFRSYSSHRSELAERWYARGVRDLVAGRAQDAVGALRTALSYAPEQRSYELKLAQALEQAGKMDEAFAYFSTLWDVEPGSGQLNLELARLEAKRGDQASAVRYYHAAIYGTWEGDGLQKRRDTRIELVQYFFAHNDLGAARNELLIAAGNNSDDPDLELQAAPLMARTGDLASALDLYEKVISVRPAEVQALAGGGKTAFDLGRYATAKKLLKAAQQEHGGKTEPDEVAPLLAQADRILELYPASNLPNEDRVARIMRLRELARTRLQNCEQHSLQATGPTSGSNTAVGPPPPTPLQQLDDRWKDEGRDATVEAEMRRDAARQRTEIQLVFDTENKLNQVCGAAAGEDALILLMAKSPEAVER